MYVLYSFWCVRANQTCVKTVSWILSMAWSVRCITDHSFHVYVGDHFNCRKLSTAKDEKKHQRLAPQSPYFNICCWILTWKWRSDFVYMNKQRQVLRQTLRHWFFIHVRAVARSALSWSRPQ